MYIHVADAKRGENECERITIAFAFSSDWIKRLREFCTVIVYRSNAIPKRSRNNGQRYFSLQCESDAPLISIALQESTNQSDASQ